MFAREYHIRARRSKLEGEQLDITFPRRGRPSRIRRLERAGQMRLQLHPSYSRTRKPDFVTSGVEKSEGNSPQSEGNSQLSINEVYDPDFAALLHGRPLSEDELAAEFHRLFPPEG